MRIRECEKMRLLGLSFPVGKGDLAMFRAYLETLYWSKETIWRRAKHMERFAEYFRVTSRENYRKMDGMMVKIYAKYTVDDWRIVYLLYQKMQESGELGIDPADCPGRESPHRWSDAYPPQHHPSRRIYDQLFSGLPPEETRFRQSGEGEWRFEGDAILYIVTLTEGGCTMEAYGKKDRRRWMKREYRITEGGRMELKQA